MTVNAKEKAQEIVALLPGFAFREGEHGSLFAVGEDGMMFRFHPFEMRFEIYPIYPSASGQTYPVKETDRQESITFSRAKDTEVIAKDIQRRFLPNYIRTYKKGLEELRKAVDREKEDKDFVAKLAQLAGTTPNSGATGFSHSFDNGIHIRYQHSGGTLEIRYLNEDQVEKVINLIAQME